MSATQQAVRRRTRKRGGVTTLADVAALAGVSTASVSRALNKPDQVSKQIRNRVSRAVADLNWVPHGAAKSLASLRTRTVGAITATLGNANVAAELEAMQQTLMDAGYVLLLACSGLDEGNELEQVRRLLERGVDALVLHHSSAHRQELWELLAAREVPTVVTRAGEPVEGHTTVGYDGRRAFATLTRHLLELGHRRFGVMMITSPQREGCAAPDTRVESAYAGVVETLEAADATLDPAHVTNTYFTIQRGRDCFRKIMSHRPAPTALIAMNDYLAVGAMIEAAQSGLSIPEDLSIVGFDDIEMAGLMTPGLTTMRTPDRELGMATGECIVQQLKGISVPKRIELDVEFVLRGSTGTTGSQEEGV